MKKKLFSLITALGMIFSMVSVLPYDIISKHTDIIANAIGDVRFSISDGVLKISGSGDMPDYQIWESPCYTNRQYISSVVISEGITSIGEYLCYDCTLLESVTIPSTVKRIGKNAFEGCFSLKSISIPNGILCIDYCTFKDCKELESITIPNSVTLIDNSAFENCCHIKSITIPNSVVSIGEDAFKNCTSLANVEFSDSLTSIGKAAFSGCTKLKSVSLPNSVISLGSSIFTGCTSLTDVNIPNSITSISSYMFNGCTSLSSLSIPNNITCIENGAFQKCKALTSIILPNGVTEIGSDAFNGCIALTKIKIPSNVSCIKDFTFNNCQSLSSVSLPSGLKTIESAAFMGCTILASISIPKSVTRIGDSAFYMTKWLDNLRRENPLVIINGILIDGRTCLGTVVIPSTVKCIGDSAFYGSTISGVTIPNSVTSINKSAFSSCRYLHNINIPNSVTCIEYGAFSNCAGLSQIYIPNSITSISSSTFSNCSSLQKVVIPNSVISIEKYAFSQCYKLSSITIPNSVIYIGDEIFEYNRNIRIKCVLNSPAYEYAELNGIEVELISEEPTRLAGTNRFKTAIEISKASYPSANTVVIANGYNYADALAGVPLAAAMHAPILLTAEKSLPIETLDEIKRLNADNIIILGGSGAVSSSVETTLKQNGLKIERIAGSTRFETATKIALKLQDINNDVPKDIFFVYAFNSADALSVSAIAAVKNAPIIYLKTNGDIDYDTSNYLESLNGNTENAYIIGGKGVISDEIMKKTGNALGVKPIRVSGANRFETCISVNQRFTGYLNGNSVCIATGMDFPDALAGGVFAAINRAPLFLVNGKSSTVTLSSTQKSFLKTKAPQKLYVFGGTGAVSNNHVQTVANNIA